MNASGRRQRQAKNNYNHLAPRQRPNYKRRDMATAAAHEQRLRERASQRERNKAKSKK